MSDSAADPDESFHLNHLLIVLPEPLSLIQVLFANPRGRTGANQNEKAQLGTYEVLQTQDT